MGIKKSSLRETMPYVLKRIIDEDLIPENNPGKNLTRMLVLEGTLLDIIDNGAVSKYFPDFKSGAVNALEVVRVSKRKFANQLHLSSGQREEIGI